MGHASLMLEEILTTWWFWPLALLGVAGTLAGQRLQSKSDAAQDLANLVKLRDAGVIDEATFEAKKAELLKRL